MKNKKSIAVIISAVLVFLVLIASVCLLFTKGSHEYDIVVFGDSIVGNDHSEDSVCEKLAVLTEKTVFNAGIGGTCMAANTGSDNQIWSYYSMVELSKAYEKNEFALQLSGIPKAYVDFFQVVDYVDETIKEISKINLKKAEIIVIEQGSNDYYAQTPINTADSFDTYSFTGALRSSIRSIKKVVPDATIVVVSPGYSKTGVAEGDCLSMDLGYGTMEEYVEAERKVCEEEGVFFVDFLNESGINAENYLEYLYDGLHTNEAGNARMAEMIFEKTRR